MAMKISTCCDYLGGEEPFDAFFLILECSSRGSWSLIQLDMFETKGEGDAMTLMVARWPNDCLHDDHLV